MVIGDDSAIVTRGLQELIDEHPEMTVAAVAGDRDELIAAATRHDPDVVVSDLRMPPTRTDEGLQVLRSLEAKRLRAGFVLLTQYSDPVVAAQLLSTGTRGRAYLLKHRLTNAAELHGAITAVAAGSTVIDPSIATEIVGSKTDPLTALTAAQREVLALIAEGCSNEAVADRLGITEWAVQKRVSTLFKSLGLDESPATNRRVMAALLYLSSRGTAER